MAGYYKYVAIFKSSILNNVSEKIILDPVRVEIFQGTRTYSVPIIEGRIIPAGEERALSQTVSLELKTGTYIELTARTKEKLPEAAQEFCEREIDKVITHLALLYSSDIFDKLVFRGWIAEDTAIVQAWIKLVSKLTISSSDLESQPIKLDSGSLERFSLMSKFYAKSLLYDPGEERFLFLWTALEVFPMKDTSNIQPLVSYLASITEMSEIDVKKKLDIGRIYGIRSDLVHDGKFKIDYKQKSELLSTVEDIVCVVLREMAGLKYDERLSRYLD